MDSTTLIILIVVLFLLFGGGGGYYWTALDVNECRVQRELAGHRAGRNDRCVSASRSAKRLNEVQLGSAHRAPRFTNAFAFHGASDRLTQEPARDSQHRVGDNCRMTN